MKRTVLLVLPVLLASVWLWGCGPGEAEKKETAQLEAKASRLDSLATKIEQTKQDIESSTKELINLVNEL
ncbi:MAG: hypothetical protein JW699_08425 [Chitinispirillaceae bacterium]|nr:hypothetical protein [Chitinispirillaceae bacterium]